MVLHEINTCDSCIHWKIIVQGPSLKHVNLSVHEASLDITMNESYAAGITLFFGSFLKVEKNSQLYFSVEKLNKN